VVRGYRAGVLRRLALLTVAVAAVLGLAACGDDDDGDDAAPATTSAVTSAAAPAAPTGDSGPVADVTCADVEAPAPRADGAETPPEGTLDARESWTLTFDTSCGTFVVALDTRSAPNTAASLVALAESGFFDDTVFHRIVPGFVIQGGDPTQSGSGGPGYSVVDRPATDARYVQGVVAMAKSAQDPAGTAGSQFFVVTGDEARLPPDYAVVGEVIEGLDVVTAIGELGDPATERPLRPVVIESVVAGQD
jgi:cyclophilin family peptidyl-prolyl cis-trans isomerase